MRPAFTSLLAALSWAALVFGAAASDASIAGRWYGEGNQPNLGTRFQWVSRRDQDGTLRVEFRKYEDCRLVHRHEESGRWSVEGATYRSVIDRIDGRRVDPRIEAYLIEGLKDGELRYRHVGTGTPFLARRVDEKFEFPGCEA
jgi:hypothetical protein